MDLEALETASLVHEEEHSTHKTPHDAPEGPTETRCGCLCCPTVQPSDTVTACCPRMGKFCCIAFMIRGRLCLLQGPDWPVTWCCLWPTVLVPTGLYLLFIVPMIWQRNATFGLVSTAVILWFWTTLFVTSCTNPGILMKYNEPVPKSEAHARRKCNKCMLYQPPNTFHCRDCGVCVYGYDHHCGFMGQCIGGLNVWAFYCFLINIFLTMMFMVVTMSISKQLSIEESQEG